MEAETFYILGEMSNLDIINAVDITRPTPEHVTKEQYTAMYNYALANGKLRDRNALLIHVMWYTAARISDILNLTPSDMDFKNMIITIRVMKSRRRDKKGGRTKPKVMVLPLSAEPAIEIMRYIQDRHVGSGDRIFDVRRQDVLHMIGFAGGISEYEGTSSIEKRFQEFHEKFGSEKLNIGNGIDDEGDCFGVK